MTPTSATSARARAVRLLSTTSTLVVCAAGQAFAQTAGGLGELVTNGSVELSDGGGALATSLAYVGAGLTAVAGLYAVYLSKKPQNRESGHAVFAGIALLAAGALASAPTLIGKSATSVSGAAPTITGDAAKMAFTR